MVLQHVRGLHRGGECFFETTDGVGEPVGVVLVQQEIEQEHEVQSGTAGVVVAQHLGWAEHLAEKDAAGVAVLSTHRMEFLSQCDVVGGVLGELAPPAPGIPGGHVWEKGLSRSWGSFMIWPKMSSRKPSTPRSSQNRTASNIACLTSGLR